MKQSEKLLKQFCGSCNATDPISQLGLDNVINFIDRPALAQSNHRFRVPVNYYGV